MSIFDGTERVQIEMMMKEMHENEEMFATMYSVFSFQLKAYYDALVKSGFTRQEALTIISHHGVIPGNVGKEKS